MIGSAKSMSNILLWSQFTIHLTNSINDERADALYFSLPTKNGQK